MQKYQFNHHPNPIDIVIKIMKYLLEGIAVSIAAFVLRKNIKLNEAMGIAVTAALILGVLDHFTSGKISHAVRYGAGSGMGMGFGANQPTGPIFPS